MQSDIRVRCENAGVESISNLDTCKGGRELVLKPRSCVLCQ